MNTSNRLKNQEEKQCIVIIGSYINACSIVYSLQRINYSQSIYIIEPDVSQAKCMAEVILKNVQVLKGRLSDLDEIGPFINEHIPTQWKKIILLTAEEYIEPVRMAVKNNILKNTKAYTGSALDNELIFDRLKFYDFAEKLKCLNVPKTIDSNTDPNKVFGNDYIIRVKKSWNGNKKLPRLEIVHSKKQKEQVEKSFIEQGLKRDMWCYQELLSTLDTHNISVCGWYDEECHQYAVTRKVLQHPPKTGNGDVVEIINNIPDDLVSGTERVLNALNYEGAFEMEFVFDQKSSEYKLIELNPRFWMQHGLVEEVTGDFLVRRAVGMKQLQEIPYCDLRHKYWINGNQAVYRLLKGQFEIIKYLKNGISFPSFLQTMKWAFYYKTYKKAWGKDE